MFKKIKKGDQYIRKLGIVDMTMTVIDFNDEFIWCLTDEIIQIKLLKHKGDLRNLSDLFDLEQCWKFDRKTGAEMDEEMGWGPDRTTSYIIDHKPEDQEDADQ